MQDYMQAVQLTVRLIRAAQKAWHQRWEFLVAFLSVFFITFSALIAVDLVPEEGQAPTVTLEPSPLVSGRVLGSATQAQAAELPVTIEIPTIGLETDIANPTSTDVATLDRYLNDGAVRYPTSGKLGENGNVVLFAHSSYLPIVQNSAYKAFTGIEKLKKGDRIMVSSSSRTYEYSVDTVESADAGSDAIPLTVSGQKLTLSTCDSFGTKSDRFVVTATLVESYPSGN